MKELNFNKPYLTEKEAAAFCGIAFSTFREQAKKLNIPFGFGLDTKKKIYRATDLQQIIEPTFNDFTANKELKCQIQQAMRQ